MVVLVTPGNEGGTHCLVIRSDTFGRKLWHTIPGPVSPPHEDKMFKVSMSSPRLGHRNHRERGVQRWGVKPACAVLSTHGIGIAPWTYYEHVGFEGTHYRLIRPDAVARLLHIQRVKRPLRRSRAYWWAPPAGFEPALPPPEGGALSPELRGPTARSGWTSRKLSTNIKRVDAR